jgi:hypothetical protein
MVAAGNRVCLEGYPLYQEGERSYFSEAMNREKKRRRSPVFGERHIYPSAR